MVFVTSGVTQTPQMQNAETKIKRILHRAPLLEEARASMRRLGLDQRSVGERPALDLLEEAHASLGTGPTPALVTLRENIWAAISQLNKRKTTQEAGSGSDMLTSIGRQCGWSHLDGSYFERLRDGHAQAAEQEQAEDAEVSLTPGQALHHHVECAHRL